MKAEWTPESMPDYFQLMTGTFFEIGAVYLISQRLRRPPAQAPGGYGAD